MIPPIELFCLTMVELVSSVAEIKFSRTESVEIAPDRDLFGPVDRDAAVTQGNTELFGVKKSSVVFLVDQTNL